MKLILSQWVYLPFHVGISFPINKWTGSSLVQILALVLNLIHFVAEHWTSSFPGAYYFQYNHYLDPFKIQMILFFYFSYFNCGNKRFVVLNWFLATMVITKCFTALGDIGFPKPTLEKQIDAIKNDEVYNNSHLFGHSILFVMVWHVSSVVDISNGLKRGWIINKIESYAERMNGAAVSSFRALWVSIAVCAVTIVLAVAVEVLKAANDGSVPLFPPMCRAVVDEIDNCTFMGITIPCFKLFNKDTVEHFGLGVEMGAIWTFVVTLIIGLCSCCKILDEMWFSGNESWYQSSLKIACALYAVVTSVFALIRYYWGVCKPLVVAAAVHNLCEWNIVLSLACSYKELQKYLPMASLFITFLVTLCICVPSLFLSLGLEQSFGIMLDFGMPIMFTMQLLDGEKRAIYTLPAIAHTVHIIGTILPLVFSILLSNHVSWFSTFFLEILINVTVPVAHFIYCYWSFALKRIVNGVDETPPEQETSTRRFTTIRYSLLRSLVQDEVDVPSVVDVSSDASSDPLYSDPTGGGANTNKDEDQTSSATGVKWKAQRQLPRRSLISQEDPLNQENDEDEGLLSDKHRIHKIERGMMVGFILGLITLGYIPLMYMPECDAPACFKERYVSRTSILTLSEELLESGGTLRDAVQGTPGLIELNVARANHDVAADKFVMVEKWRAKENMTEDTITYFVDTSGDFDFNKAEIRRQLDAATVNTMTCSSEKIDTIEVQAQYSCDKVWRVLDTPGYCAWIPGCKFAESMSSQHVQLFMGGGARLSAVIAKNKVEKKIAVSVLTQTELPGYSAVVTLKKPRTPWSFGGKSCNLKYESRINMAYLSSQKRSDNFNESFLPDLYTKLSGK